MLFKINKKNWKMDEKFEICLESKGFVSSLIVSSKSEHHYELWVMVYKLLVTSWRLKSTSWNSKVWVQI